MHVITFVIETLALFAIATLLNVILRSQRGFKINTFAVWNSRFDLHAIISQCEELSLFGSERFMQLSHVK